MKKILLTVAAGLMAFVASAYTLQTPQFYTEDFTEMSKVSEYLTNGWLTYGNGVKPIGNAAKMYETSGKGPYYLIWDQGSSSIPMANTDFEGGVEADEWMISPEIEVPYGVSTLMFTVATYTGGYDSLGNPVLGSSDADDLHSFKVLVSEGGVEKSDFVEVFNNSVRHTGSSAIEMYDKIVPINGYEGKKVRVAFVVNGKMQGLTGFTNLRWGQYTMFIDTNLTRELAIVDSPITIDYNIKMKAPTTCPNIKAELFINNEKITETTYKKAFGSATSFSTVIQRIQFKNVYTPTTDEAISYQIIVTPEFENAIPSEIEGSLGFPKYEYKSNVVVEEVTGTGCQFCTRGIGALEYYKNTYPGTDEVGKVIPIAIHNTLFGPDKMAIGNERYSVSVSELNGSANMPLAVMNRATRGSDPSNAIGLAKLIAEISYNEATITGVEMPEGDIIDIAGQPVTVAFEVKNGYDSSSRELTAAVVLIENNVKGRSSEYNQANAFSRSNNGAEVVSACSSYGTVKEMAPFFEPFTATGKLGRDPIPYNLMEYQDVSRGIFPDFAGTPIAKEWVAGEPQRFEIKFNMPSNVMDVKNTAVAVLIMNSADRKIVASDIMEASEFNKVNAVEEIEISNNSGETEYYNMQGLKVANPSAGIYIQRNGNVTKKVVIK